MGDGNSTGLCNFWDILIGRTNGEVSGSSYCSNGEYTIANQQAGYDLRYSFNLLNVPMSFYEQKFAEGGS